MSSHFSTPFVDENGDWLPLAHRKNISADIAPTAGQMPRGLGLALVVEGMLRRLRTDRIDLYYAHKDDGSVPVARQSASADRK